QTRIFYTSVKPSAQRKPRAPWSPAQAALPTRQRWMPFAYGAKVSASVSCSNLSLSQESAMTEYARPRLIGFNHVALEVGDIEEALAFYGRLFTFELRGKSATMAFIDLGDQFIALQTGRSQSADDGRHVGLVVDDKHAARKALEAAGVAVIGGPFLDFR